MTHIYTFASRARDRAGSAKEARAERELMEFASFLLSVGHQKSGPKPILYMHPGVQQHIDHGVDIASAVRVVLKCHKEDWYHGYRNEDWDPKGPQGPKAQVPTLQDTVEYNDGTGWVDDGDA